MARMDGELRELFIEDANQAAVPPNPDVPSPYSGGTE